MLPPWRLVFLEGGVASAASYPAWDVVTEKARPKVLVFLEGGVASEASYPA